MLLNEIRMPVQKRSLERFNRLKRSRLLFCTGMRISFNNIF